LNPPNSEALALGPVSTFTPSHKGIVVQALLATSGSSYQLSGITSVNLSKSKNSLLPYILSLAKVGWLCTPNPSGNSLSAINPAIKSTWASTTGTNAFNLEYNFFLANSLMLLAIPPTLISDGWIPSPATISTTYCAVFLMVETLLTASANKFSGTISVAIKKWCIAWLLTVCAAKVNSLNNWPASGTSISSESSIASTEAKVWGIGQTPQILWHITGAVSGAFPATSFSKPLTGVILKYLPFVTIPSSSTSMTSSACPSWRDVGDITIFSLKCVTSLFIKN